MKQESALPLRRVLHRPEEIIEGFPSPLGFELLATLDWLIAQRKQRLFTDRLIDPGLNQLMKVPDIANSPMVIS